MITYLLLAPLGSLLAMASPNNDNDIHSPRPKPFDCGTNTDHASSDFIKSISSLHSDPNSGSPAARAAHAAALKSRSEDKTITIDTVFHVVASPSKKSAISNSMPTDQLTTLNEAYAPQGISFNLLNVSWTTNDAWASGSSADADLDMKKSLRQGTYSTLNIYFQTDLSGGALGRCTLPSPVGDSGASDTGVYASDGCNVNAMTMPGGSMEGYNSGKTAVHETGHWLGLLHTFEGYSCEGEGDFIDDTPFEKESTEGCPVEPPKRTCPDQVFVGGGGEVGAGGDGGEGAQEEDGGVNDPIHNFMDYSIDSCYTGFTTGQRERMWSLWGLYREGK